MSFDLAVWFLTVEERGIDATTIDHRHGDGRPWTEANSVEVHVDGAAYFRRLQQALSSVAQGDHVFVADWQSDGDELLAGSGTEVGRAFAAAARRGAELRGLLWRSHPRQAHLPNRTTRPWPSWSMLKVVSSFWMSGCGAAAATTRSW